MKNKFGIREEYIGKISALFGRYDCVKEAIVFGSRAKGNYRNGSDIDIALKGELINSKILTQIELDYENLNLPWKLNLIVYDGISNEELKEHIDRVGKRIYPPQNRTV